MKNICYALEDSFWDYLQASWPHEDDYWAEHIHNTHIYSY